MTKNIAALHPYQSDSRWNHPTENTPLA